MEAKIRGIPETQKTIRDMDDAVRGDRGMQRTLSLALLQLHRYATGIVHVDTGRLKNSLFWSLERSSAAGATGIVATNVSYALAEHSRGGGHAFFARTVREEGKHVNSMVAANMQRSLSRG
ncbi:MAG: hypothetical protein WBO46_14970 [Caldilineaceae bacterium]